MPRDPELARIGRIETAAEYCDRIDEYLSGMDEAAFLASQLHQDAVCMLLMQTAEILKPVDDIDGELRATIPDMGRILGMRNMIAHEYRVIDMGIIWMAATCRIPQLRRRLLALLSDSSSRP